MSDSMTAVHDRDARLLGGEGVVNLQSDMRTRYWEDVKPALVEESMNGLRSYTSQQNEGVDQKYVEDLVIDGTVLEGKWRCGKVYSRRDDSSGKVTVFQELHRGFVTSLGTGGPVDWSEFYILNEEGFHANHEMPVLRLSNVAPSAVHDLVAYLNQDTFTDITYRDDTLDGTFYRRKVVAGIEADGSYHIDVLLTDDANTDLYFHYQASPDIIKGYFYKWEATEATLTTLLESTWFDSSGNKYDSNGAGRYSLQDSIAGRTVVVNRISRGEDDRLFDSVVEITWTTAVSVDTSSTPHGAYDRSIWTEQFHNYTSLPSANDLSPSYDTPSNYTTSSTGTETPVLGELWAYSGTYYECILSDGSPRALSNTTYFAERDLTTTPFGSWSITKELRGPNGTGMPQYNQENKTYSYSIMTTRVDVVGPTWYLDGLVGFDTRRNRERVSFGVQPIRQRLGGELAYEKDDSGNLSGVSWNLDWDDGGNANGGSYPTSTPPDNWVTHGYYARYGEWKDYWKKGYAIGEGSLLDGSVRLAPGSDTTFEELTCKGVYTDEDEIYQIGDVVYYPGSGDQPDGVSSSGFYRLTGGTAWADSTGYTIGDVVRAGNRIYTCAQDHTAGTSTHPQADGGAAYWDEGGQGGVTSYALTWTSYSAALVKSLIAIEGVGEAPFEQPDYHIPIQQELQEEVEWDSGWEWISDSDGGAYNSGDIVMDLNDGNLYENQTGTNTDTEPSSDGTNWSAASAGSNPTDWDASYASRYGDWKAAWTKAYAYGPGSLRSTRSTGSTCRGAYSATDIYNIDDVTLYSGDLAAPVFKVVTGATAWADSTGYVIGDVVQAGNNVYTCTQANTASDANHPQNPDYGGDYWDKGAEGGDVTWGAFDEDYVVSKIAISGVGASPFEEFTTVGVIDETGSPALSSSARYAFYNNFAVNPRIAECFRFTKQREATIEFVAYYAVNPHWLPYAVRRTLQSWANIAAFANDIEASPMDNGASAITDILPSDFGFNAQNSNFGMACSYQKIDNELGVWVARKRVSLRTEEEFDGVAANAYLDRLDSNSSGYIVGDMVKVKHDLSSIEDEVWSGGFLDVS